MKKTTTLFLSFIMFVFTNSCKEEKIDATKYTEVTAKNQMIYVWALNGILNKENGSSDFIFGGEKEKDQICIDCYKESLNEWWEITDQKSLLSAINELKNGNMHNLSFKEDYNDIGFYEFSEAEFKEFSKENPEYYDLDTLVWNHKKIYKEKGILAWDLIRASSLIAWGYMADYISYKKAYELCLEIGNRIQTNFSSYNQMIENYLTGYLYWSENVEDYNTRKDIAEKLLEDENSAWNIFPFDYDLSKKELVE